MSHENSVRAYREERSALVTRNDVVLEYIKRNGPVTDRRVMRGLGFREPNQVRPRITELLALGLVEETLEKARCPETGKTVRMVRAKVAA